MPKRTLQIVSTAYRATIEEQDDPVLWLSLAMKGQGGAPDVLLSGHAVNYGVAGQEVAGLTFGSRTMRHPVRLAEDVARLMEKGVTVYVVEEDVARRGLTLPGLIPGLKPVANAALPRLFAAYDQVWHW